MVKHSEETKKKISESHKGIRPSKKTLKKMSLSRKRLFAEGKMVPWNIGIPRKEEFKLKQSETMKRLYREGIIQNYNKGRIFSDEERKKMSVNKIGKISPKKGKRYPNVNIWNRGLKDIHLSPKTEFKKGMIPWNKGLTKENNKTIKKIAETKIGDKSHFWKGGIAYEPYDKNWNKEFRKIIKIRDNFICQKCNIIEEDCKRIFFKPLDVHHIDYNKTLSIKENCITLCPRCHGETMHNREAWKSFYQIMLSNKYGYNYNNQEVIIDFNRENK